VPWGNAGVLSSAVEAGRQADRAKVARLILTHLLPGTDPAASRRAAARSFGGKIEVATAGASVDLP
jgi:ribonuclease BN (tRNA processing enzyme)